MPPPAGAVPAVAVAERASRPAGVAPAAGSASAADVIVVGDGVIGLAVALAVASRGASCRIIGHPSPGAASAAAGGLLAPSIGEAPPAVRAVLMTAREGYPAYLHWLAERTGIEVALNRLGILEVASSPEAFAELTRHAPAGVSLLSGTQAVGIEPPLVAAAGALYHPADGAVDNVRLLEAMREAVRCEWAIESVVGRVVRLQWKDGSPAAITEDGQRHAAAAIVLAAGAWSPLVDGLPRPLRLEPVRGQMLALQASLVRHVIAGAGVYLVPRAERTLVGSTLERVGFDSGTTPGALGHLHEAAGILCPDLRDAAVAGGWAGLRPVTPDFAPIIGRDPDQKALLYACGHGKNGILLAPLTGECVAALLAGTAPPVDLRPFAVERF